MVHSDRAYASDSASRKKEKEPPKENEKIKKMEREKIRNKHGQEEMVGFALIIIIVAVILLVFIGFSLRSSTKDTVESYEVQSFIQSFLQYTTDCRDRTNDLLTVRELILECNDQEKCSNGEDTCVILNSVIGGITNESWKVGEDRPIKGYELNISSQEKSILTISDGVQTENSKGAPQNFVKSGEKIFIYFKAYY